MPPAFVPPKTPQYVTGQVVAVKVGNSFAYCMSGNADETAVVIKRTNSRSGGFQEIRFGNKQMDGALNIAYNGDDPPAIKVGTFATLIIDTVGHLEPDEGATAAPTGEYITVNAGITKISRSWNNDSGDYTWNVTFTSSGAYEVAESTTPTV